MGTAYSKKQCYIHALGNDLNNSVAWYNLGLLLNRGHTVQIKRTEYSKKCCFVRALNLDPSLEKAWCNLGFLLKSEDIEMIKGTEYDKLACYKKAISINPRYSTAWYNYGINIPRGKLDCFKKAAEYNPLCPLNWRSIRMITHPDDTISFGQPKQTFNYFDIYYLEFILGCLLPITIRFAF